MEATSRDTYRDREVDKTDGNTKEWENDTEKGGGKHPAASKKTVSFTATRFKRINHLASKLPNVPILKTMLIT